MTRMRSFRDTAVPLPPAPGPSSELRREQRLCTLFRTAKLVSAAGETLCRVRNISPNGFMADACPAPAVGDKVGLQLCEGRSHLAKVVWAQADRFGGQFLQTQSVPGMIDEAFSSPHHRHRALRVAPKDAAATILHTAQVARASIVNISQTGVSIFGFDLFLGVAARREVQVEIDGLDPMAGTLCWAADGAAGIQFKRPLSFETLSHWLWATSLAAGPEWESASGA
jgi:hypothetical protein